MEIDELAKSLQALRTEVSSLRTRVKALEVFDPPSDCESKDVDTPKPEPTVKQLKRERKEARDAMVIATLRFVETERLASILPVI